MAKKLTKSQERYLELKRQEEIVNDQLIQDAKELVDFGRQLTKIQQNRINELKKDKALTSEVVDLENLLTQQSKSYNKKKAKTAQLAKAQLDVIKSQLKNEKINLDQYKQQADILQEIADGTLSAEDIQDRINDLGEDATEEMRAYLTTQKQSLKSQEDLSGAADSFKDLLGDIGSDIASFMTNPLTIIAAIIKSYADTMAEVGKEFGALGMQNEKFKEDMMSARTEAVALGQDITDITGIMATLTDEFGFSRDEARKLSTSIMDTSMALGLSNEEGAKLFGVLTEIGGLNAANTEQFMKQTALLAQAEGVAPQAVLQDMANSSEAIAKFSDGSAEGLAKAAIMANKLGTNLDTVAGIAEGLLDFQTSLNSEIEASILLGRDINFQKARELALSNDIEGAMAAVVDELGSAEEFEKLNVIQRKALADAIGVSVDQLAKFVNKEEKAYTLSDAIAKQGGWENLVGKDSLDNIAKIIVDFKKMGAELVERIGPTMISFVSGLGSAVEFISQFSAFLPLIVGYMTMMKTISIATAVAKIWSTAMTSKGMIPFVGLALGAAAAIAATATMMNAVDEAGDMISPARGRTMVSTKEGGLFQMSQNDDLLAGPGLAKASMGNNQPIVNVNTAKMEKQNEEMKKEMAQLRKDMASYFGFGGTTSKQIGNRIGRQLDGRL